MSTEERHASVRRKEDVLLAEEAARFESMTRGVKDYAIILIDPAGQIISWNSGATKLLGFEPGEAIGRPFSFIFTEHDISQQVPAKELSTATLDGNASDNRWHARKEGSLVWVAGLVMRLEDDSGNLAAYCKIMQDATHFKRLQQELEERSHMLNLAHVFVRNLEDRITYWNLGSQVLYGYTADEALGRSGQELLKTKFPQPYEEIRDQVLTQGSWEGELIHTCKDGRIVTVASHWVLRKDAQGQPASILVVNNDMTQQKLIEEALRLRTMQLVRSNQDLERFAYTVSHDLQQPLRKIAAEAAKALSREKKNLSRETRNSLCYIEESAGRMTDLVVQLLSYARAGRTSSANEVLSLQEVTDDVVKDLSESIRAAGATVHYRGLPSVWGDAVGLYQLMQNLIANAVKFHGPHPPVIEISGRLQNDKIEVAVRDNGIGIAPEQLERVFDVFHRGARAQSYAGTGIGLATCKRIVEAHGGEIRAESKAGEGTTFYFTLPAAKAEVPHPELQ